MNRSTNSAPALPAWARAADAVTVLLGLSAFNVAAFGGIRVGSLFSMSTPWRALFVLAAVCGLRHYVVRTPPLYRRLWRGLRGAWRDKAIRTVWPTAVVTRVSVLFVGYFAVVAVGYAPDGPPYRWSDNEALNLPLRWDTGWYLGIAQNGYSWGADYDGPQNIAFFPGYPLITNGVATLLGAEGDVVRRRTDRSAREREQHTRMTFLGSALLVSLLTFAWSMVWLYRLAREHLDEQAARGAVLLLAAYPFAVYYSAAYSESLMLLSIVGAFYHLKHKRWIWAAFWGLLAGVTRPNGFLLAAPLTIIALQQALARRPAQEAVGRRVRRVLAAGAVCAMPAVGMVLYSVFIHSITGDLFAWREAHEAWGRDLTGLALLQRPFDWVATRGIVPYTTAEPTQALNLMGSILACVLIWPVTRRFGAAYGLFMAVSVAPPLLFGGYLSMGRVTCVLFPMFMYLALVLADRQRQALIAGFACVQGLAAVLFFTWRDLV